MTVMSPLADRIVRAIRDRPQQFAETVDAHRDVPWPEFLRAWGEVRALNRLERDEDGRYYFKDSEVPAAN